MAENMEYRSDVFCMLLQNPKYALNVYNFMNDSDYTNPEELKIYILENGISLSIRNDASFIIYNHLCVYEHQGSYNPNMAIRELICEAININPNKNMGLKKKSYVLEDFFRRHGDEVKKMTVLDFTFERRIELEKRDARAEGGRVRKVRRRN